MIGLLQTYWHDVVSAVVGAGLSYVVTRWFLRKSVALEALRPIARQAQREAAEQIADAALRRNEIPPEAIEQAIMNAGDGFFRNLQGLIPSPYDVIGTAVGVVSCDPSHPEAEAARKVLAQKLRREDSTAIAIRILHARKMRQDLDEEELIGSADDPGSVRTILAILEYGEGVANHGRD